MASLNDILNLDPVQLTASVTNNPVVEPLGSPGSVDDVMDRFPETVYQQGKDTRLYRFITALCGDSGAGLLRKQAFAARLGTEAEVLTFRELDDFYVQHFKFRRIASELYDLDPEIEYITTEELDDIQSKDDKYRHRLQDFFKATRYGGTPKGLAMVARAGSGLTSEVVEGYEWIFDQYSDDPLDLVAYGSMPRINGFDIFTHAIDYDETLLDEDAVTESTAIFKEWVRSAPVYGSVTTKADLRANTTKVGESSLWGEDTKFLILPSIERNVLDLVDRVRPVNALMQINTMVAPLLEVAFDTDSVFATSENFTVNRFVTGKPLTGSWPELSRTSGTFIVQGEEREALTGHHRRLWPVIFHTIETVQAYGYKALSSTNYNTRDWYEQAEYIDDLSRHIGTYSRDFAAIFPMLQNAPVELEYVEDLAIAARDTALILEGKFR